MASRKGEKARRGAKRAKESRAAESARDEDARPNPNEAPASDPVSLWTRRAGRLFPVVAVIGAITVAMTVGPGPAFLVLVGCALLGAIALGWTSVRALGGDVPVEGFADLGSAGGRQGFAPLAEQKRAVLRTLKDLELELSVGKLSKEDYERVAAPFRAEAKRILRQIDHEIAPKRSRAESLARAYLRDHGVEPIAEHAPATLESGELPVVVPDRASGGMEVVPRRSADDPDDDGEPHSGTLAARPPTSDPEVDGAANTCASCDTSNDADAAFCKKCGSRLGEAAPGSADVLRGDDESGEHAGGNDDSVASGRKRQGSGAAPKATPVPAGDDSDRGTDDDDDEVVDAD